MTSDPAFPLPPKPESGPSSPMNVTAWKGNVTCVPSLAAVASSSRSSPLTRGLHSFAFQLNLSALYGIGVARRGLVARVKGVLGGV